MFVLLLFSCVALRCLVVAWLLLLLFLCFTGHLCLFVSFPFCQSCVVCLFCLPFSSGYGQEMCLSATPGPILLCQVSPSVFYFLCALSDTLVLISLQGFISQIFTSPWCRIRDLRRGPRPFNFGIISATASTTTRASTSGLSFGLIYDAAAACVCILCFYLFISYSSPLFPSLSLIIFLFFLSSTISLRRGL